MNPSPGDFDQLQRLLSLKRHEMPPPGYFSHFSDKVIARIEAGSLASRAPWWQRWWNRLDAGPVLICSYGGAVVGLLVIGFGVLDSVEPENTVTASVVANPWVRPAAETGPSIFAETASVHPAISRAASPTSITPVMSRAAVPASLFDVSQLRTEPASFTFR